MDSEKASLMFNENLDMWKEWSMRKDVINWVDNRGIKHSAYSISELREWFESHTARN